MRGRLPTSGRIRSGERAREHHEPVVALIRVLLMFEAAMYAAVTPVLPHYAHLLHAGKPEVGLLAAAYPAGIVPGSVLGGWLATRAGVKRTTVFGLLVFAVSIIGFGFAGGIDALDGLRAVQGVACGSIWGGGLTWVIAVAPRDRRGEIIGSVMAAAIFGTLLGPVLGTLAVTAGTGPVFACVGAVALGLAGWTAGRPGPGRAARVQREAGTSPWLMFRDRRAVLGSWLILLEACAIGACGTLLPLRLARFGASGLAIGATFLLASLLSTIVAPWIGRSVDRRGAGIAVVAGLIGAAALIAVIPLPRSPLALAALSAIMLGGPLTAFTIPAIAVVTDSAERVGVAIAMVTTMLNLAWALGETIGAPAAAGLSQATSDAVPLLVLAVLMLLTVVPVRRARLRRTSADAVGAATGGPRLATGGPGGEQDDPACVRQPALAGR